MTKNYTTGYECERCGTETSVTIGDTTFIHEYGVYFAHLCLRCKSEWERYIRPHAAWMALITSLSKITMLTAMSYGDGHDRTEELIEAERQKNAILIELAGVAAAWVEGA